MSKWRRDLQKLNNKSMLNQDIGPRINSKPHFKHISEAVYKSDLFYDQLSHMCSYFKLSKISYICYMKGLGREIVVWFPFHLNQKTYASSVQNSL